MSAALAITTVVAALAAGYGLGRLRPLDRLDTWVWRQFAFGGPWFATKPRQAVLLAVHALVRLVATWHAWRHRHNPPRSSRAPAPRLDPQWAADRTTPPGEEPPA